MVAGEDESITGLDEFEFPPRPLEDEFGEQGGTGAVEEAMGLADDQPLHP